MGNKQIIESYNSSLLFGLFGSGLFRFDLLLEFQGNFLSLDGELLGCLVELSLDLLLGHSGDALDLLDSLSLSSLLGLVIFELLVHSSPDDGPSEGLGLELSSEESEALGS